MEMQALDINYTAAQDEGNFDALKATVDRLFNATQEEFETIKNEAWYVRVFDMVTLSNKKEIRLANQIGNIAQSQEVVLELLLRLSNTSATFSDLLASALEKMKTHTELSIRLAERIKRVESILCYGSAKSLHIKDLKETGKIVLVGLIHKAHELLSNPTPHQQKYISGLFKALDSLERPANLKNALELLDSLSDRKLLMEIVLEYCALSSADSDFKPVVEDILEDLDLSRKVGAQLQEKIDRNLKLMGQDGLAAKYDSSQQVYDLEEPFGIELESSIDESYSGIESADEPEYMPYGEKEPYNFDKFETVLGDAHKIYANKIINFGSVLTLEGKLTFKNCTILYNIPQQLSKISCRDNASIDFFDCEIKCIEKRDNFFIDAGSSESITLNMISCELIEGYNFYCCNNENSVTKINDCVIIDPIEEVIKSWQGEIYFENTKVCITDIEKCKKYGNGYADIFSSKKIKINNCIVSCEWRGDCGADPASQKRGRSRYDYEAPVHYGSIFHADNIIISQSSLVEIKNLIGYGENVEIDRCDFYKCFYLTTSNTVMKITNSNFIKNKNIKLRLGKESKLSFCQFIGSEGNILESSYKGGVLIDSCEFYNTSSLNQKGLDFCRDYESSKSTIKNSIFYGVSVCSKNTDKSWHHVGLIASYASDEKYSNVLSVENCAFRNISGSDVFSHKQTFTTWIFNETERSLISFANCIGIDPIISGDGIEMSIPYRTCTTEGELIGSSLTPGQDKTNVVENEFSVTLEKVEVLGLI
jgi:hypothetical protein